MLNYFGFVFRIFKKLMKMHSSFINDGANPDNWQTEMR